MQPEVRVYRNVGGSLDTSKVGVIQHTCMTGDHIHIELLSVECKAREVQLSHIVTVSEHLYKALDLRGIEMS